MSTEPKPLVLVVDDDPDFVELHEQILTAAGFEVAVAYGPDEGFALARARRPAAVVTDLMMSTLQSGFTLAKRVRTELAPPPVPVVIVTSVGASLGLDFRPRSAEDLAAMNADAFFAKPVAPDRLVATVRELCARRTTA
jgi:DNA-binding response OmpR family regulator